VTPLTLGVLIAVVTTLVLLSGVPVAVGLGLVAMTFLLFHDGPGSLVFMSDLFFGHLDDFTLLAIPMFIVMGAAVAASKAGADLYGALDRWLYKVPGDVCRHRQDGHPRHARARL
jgi:C4-dicarboxylate transporter DctM subunit